MGPTEPQAAGWPSIAAVHVTRIAAPNGSGKTVAAFLDAIDRLQREHRDAVGTRAADGGSAAADDIEVVYVSPLKALAADIEQNLQKPLGEIRATAREL